MALQEKAKYWVDHSAATLASTAKMLLLSKRPGRAPRQPGKDKLVVLGNGPSLKDSLAKLQQEREKADFLGVNLFGQTPAYAQVKPEHYVITAPEFWDLQLDAAYRQRMDRFFAAFADQTTWPVQLHLPFSARKSPVFRKLIDQQPLIRLHFFNTTPVEGFSSFRHWAYRSGLGMPRPQNVLIPSIMLGIRQGYRELYLYGADHSWLPEIRVMEDNTVLLTQKHFYDYQSAKANPMRKLGRGQRKLHEVLHKFYHSFRAYFLIREFAENEGVRIYNSTPGSFIDAFNRKSLIT